MKTLFFAVFYKYLQHTVAPLDVDVRPSLIPVVSHDHAIKRLRIAIAAHACVVLLLIECKFDALERLLDDNGVMRTAIIIVALAMFGILAARWLIQYTRVLRNPWPLLVPAIIFAPCSIPVAGDAWTNQFREKNARASLAQKIDDKPLMSGGGLRGSDLSAEEYNILRRYRNRFPDLPTTSRAINFAFAEDGFLPDYYLEIMYRVPVSTPVDSFNRDTRRREWRQSVATNGTWKQVRYFEGCR